MLDYRREGTPALLPAFLQRGQLDVPLSVMASELLRIRTLMACEAVRLAARYGTPEALAEARTRLAAAPALADDPVGHAANELELYRALVSASGIWPAAWLVNSFWGPLREAHRMLAPVMGPVPPGFQGNMEELLEHIEQRRELEAVALVQRWFDRVDAELVAVLEAAVTSVRTDRDSR